MNLNLRHVTKNFDLDGLTTVVPVKDINLDISNGDFIIVSGCSGSGKTTLLNLAAGLVRPTEGVVSINGIDLRTMNDEQWSVFHSRKIGFIFQFPSLLPALTVEENVMLPTVFGLKQNWREIYQRASALINTVGLSTRKRA
jgi:ABC-type lipoprotein export system ATPase subunit